MTGIILAMLGAFTVGFLWGRLEEWRRVLAYLHKYEDEDEKPVWWLAAGIAADAHWNNRGRTAWEDVHG